MLVPFFTNKHQDVRYGQIIRRKIDEVICGGNFILGAEVKHFEDKLRNYIGCEHVVACANGSDALYLAVQSLDLPKHAEIITTPYTFFASAACITRNGLNPVFVDIEEDTYHINSKSISDAVTEKTRAVLPVDLFSHTVDIDAIRAVAEKYNLKIIQDSAEAFGMKWDDHHAGQKADVSVLSFFPTKTLGCFGDGGAVFTNNALIADFVRKARVHGMKSKYYHELVGINSRLDELQAAILNVKFNYVEEEIAERNQIANEYFIQLRNVTEIKFPRVPKPASGVWYVINIQCKARNELQAFLAGKGISTSVYYPQPLHLQKCFEFLGYKKGMFPIAEKLAQTTLALPIFVGMTVEQISYICDTIKHFYLKN